MKRIILALVTAGLLGAQAAAAPAAKDKVLKAGEYSATAKALVCAACAAEIEKTLKARPGIESASVDPKTSTVSFTIKKGASVKVRDLQSSLKTAADNMGMGADYSLMNLKRASVSGSMLDKGTKPSAPAAEQAVYSCPMHPDVASAKPGACPQCGMTLQKK